MVSKQEIQSSKSSMSIAFKAKKSGQLTENSCIFDLKDPNGRDTGISVSLGLIFNKKVKADFDVVKWYSDKSMIMKERITELIYRIAFDKDFCNQFLKRETGTTMLRTITSDPVKNDDSNLIGYLFEITYTRF